MPRKTLGDTVRAAAGQREGKRVLPCARAFRLAAKHNVSLREIGRVCNEQRIAICACRLGCFK